MYWPPHLRHDPRAVADDVRVEAGVRDGAAPRHVAGGRAARPLRQAALPLTKLSLAATPTITNTTLRRRHFFNKPLVSKAIKSTLF